MAGTIKLYLDDNVAGAITDGLRQNGVDVLSVPDTKTFGVGDEDHLARARRPVIFTHDHDTDYLRLHTAGEPHADIVFAPHGTLIGRIVRALLLIYHCMEADEMENHVERVMALAN